MAQEKPGQTLQPTALVHEAWLRLNEPNRQEWRGREHFFSAAAEAMAATLHLRILEPPLPLSAYALNLMWHPRLENEPANQWLREVFVRAAMEAAPESSRDTVAAAPGRRRTRRPR
jgi:hypothetical protein